MLFSPGPILSANSAYRIFHRCFLPLFALFFVLLVLAPFLRFNNNIKQNWRAVLAFCLLMGVGVYSTMYWALYAAGGASAILIGTQLSTPFAVLLGAWLLGERASWVVWGGITLTMIGVLIVGFDTAVLGYPLAFALVLLSAIFYASANVVLRGLRKFGGGAFEFECVDGDLGRTTAFFDVMVGG